MTLYVTEQGAKLSIRSGRLVVEKAEVVLTDLPLEHVRQIVLIGHIHLTTRTVHHCLTNGVDVCYCTQDGRYRGRLMPEGSWHVTLRQAQYGRSADLSFALQQAKAFVQAKLSNGLVLLKRFPPLRAENELDMERLNALRRQVQAAETIETLRGYEGAAADLYFRLFACRLPDGWTFPGRRKHPAPDPVNAMLSLTYTMVYHLVVSALHIAGLDPYLGCLHRPHHGHAALASDLMEEFRPVLTDNIVLSMIRHREVQPSEFTMHPGGGCRISQEKLKRLLARFDARLDEETSRTPDQQQHTYRRLIINQAYQFARVVQGKQERYEPYRWTY